MPKKHTHTILPGRCYHLYNRGINGQDIFYRQDNYRYFLRLYRKHVTPVADTFAYCLLKNHFHFLIRAREARSTAGKMPLSSQEIGLAFGTWLNAYAQAFNREVGRTGGLFERPFRRVPIESEEQLIQNVFYIHANPQKHGFNEDFRSYLHSSYGGLVSDASTQLNRAEVLSWFGGREKFVAYHEVYHDYLAVMLDSLE